MAEKRKCPHCGAPVYATDDVCMSCGKSLTQPRSSEPERPQAPPPPTQPPATRRPRPAAAAPVTARIVGTFGGFWDIFPWVALVFSAMPIGIPIAMQFTGFDPSGVLTGVVLILFVGLSSLVGLALLAWIIIDVLDQQVGILWIFIAIFLCHPIGLLLYLLMARE